MRKILPLIGAGLVLANSVLADAVDQYLPKAISAVETGGNPRAIGQAGERGLLQYQEETWKISTKRLYGKSLPFSDAFNSKISLEVGLNDFKFAESEIRKKHGSVYDKLDERSKVIVLATAHTKGLGYVLNRKIDIKTFEELKQRYSDRVANLKELYAQQDRQKTWKVVGLRG